MSATPRPLERDAELDAIETILRDGVSGTGTRFAIVGGAGIGKSTLLALGRRRAEALDYTVLAATGGQGDTTVVHTVARQWFGPLVAATPAGEPPFDGPAAVLVDLVAAAGAQVGERSAMILGCRWALESLRENGPVLLIVDDDQWIDEASRRLLADLAPVIADLGVVLATATRTGATEGVARADEAADGASPDLVLRPQPLGVDALATYLERYLAHPMEAQTAEALRASTGGVPFAVEEALASITADASEETVLAALAARLPDETVAALTRRIATLPADARAVGVAVAVIGPERAGLHAAAAVAEVPPADVAALVDQLAAARVLHGGVEPLRVIHPLVERALLDSVGAAVRSQLHARAFDVLSATGHHATDLAGHAYRAPARGDGRVVEVLDAAARDALRRGAPETAVVLLDRALREPPPAPIEVELLLRCAAARIRAGDVAAGIDQYQSALARTDEAARRVELYIDLGDALAFAGSMPEAIDAFERARTVLDENGYDSRHPLRRRLLAHIAPNVALLTPSWHHDIWSSVAAAAAEAPAQDTYDDRLLYVTAALGTTLSPGSHTDALDLVRRGLDGTRLVREETSDSTVLFAATGVLLWADEYDEARVVLDAALADARVRGSVLGNATARYCSGCTHWLQGDPRRAVADERVAVDARDLGWNQYLGAAHGVLIVNLLELGEVEQARAALVDADRDVWRDSMQDLFLGEAAGLLALADGDRERALAEFLATEQLRAAVLPNPAGSDCWLHAVTLLTEDGRRDEAQTLLDGVTEPSEAWGAPRTLGLLDRGRALLAVDADDRARLLRRSADHLRRAGARLELARSLLRLDDVDAVQEAADVARAAGAVPLAERAQERLVELGAARAEDESAPATWLTPAELRVAELAASGLTNREVAATLFVTVKAVEWHLTRVYHKLGVTGRDHLAAALT